jgi:hypothetical protein
MRSMQYIVYITLIALSIGFTAGAPLQTGGSDGTGNLKSDVRRVAGLSALNVSDWEIANLLSPVKDESPIGSVTLARNIDAVLKEVGVDRVPSVNIRLTRPPLLLVVSPREKILYLDRLLISPDLNSSQIEALEENIDSLGLSSLVVEIGGFGAAYPAIVSRKMRTRAIVSAAVEEWSHQYLAFRPLGFLYLADAIGFSQNAEVINMNETLAGIMADEIGSKVYDRYYRAYDDQSGTDVPDTGFNFSKEMQETRRTVDLFLSTGEISEAEKYMASRSESFAAHGYNIRKLNQAYFAFHGIYGQDPCAVSPVYDMLKKLRDRYAQLSDYIKDMSAMTSYSDLQAAAGRLDK